MRDPHGFSCGYGCLDSAYRVGNLVRRAGAVRDIGIADAHDLPAHAAAHSATDEKCGICLDDFHAHVLKATTLEHGGIATVDNLADYRLNRLVDGGSVIVSGSSK